MKKLFTLMLVGGMLLLGAESVFAKYYLKHPWNGGDWSVREVTASGTNLYSCLGVYGNDGCNFGNSESPTGWKEKENIVNNDKYSLGDLCIFTYNSSDNSITLTSPATRTVTIYVAANEDLYIHAWTDYDGKQFGHTGAWHTTKATETNVEFNGATWYKYVVSVYDNAAFKIIFSNNSKQTEDIYVDAITQNATLCFEVSDNGGDKLAVSKTAFLKGTFNKWEGVNAFVNNQLSIDLSAGSYTFKVQDGASWWGKESTDITSSTTITDMTNVNGDQYNMTITANIDGNYTFVWDGTSHEITVIYPVQLSAAAEDGYGYASLYIPYEVAIPDGVSAYYQSSSIIDGTSVTVNFTKLSDYIPENTPVILRGTANVVFGLTYTTTGATVTKDAMFKGVNSTTEFASLDKNLDDYVYVLAGSGANFGFHQLASTGHVNASRCYLVVPAANSPAHAPAINMLLQDENRVTAIQFFNAEEKAQDNNIYTILGQRVESMSAPGIYIQNGKKYIVK